MFIIRNPFITNTNRARAYILLDLAQTMAVSAEYLLKLENPDTENAVRLLQEAGKHLNNAARELGFRNTADMEKWRQKHGRLP